jgi:integrase
MLNCSFSEVSNQFIASLDTAYAHRSSEPLSNNTRKLYSNCANRAAASLGSLALADVNAIQVRGYIAELKRESLKPATIVAHYTVLKKILEFPKDDCGNPLIKRSLNLGFIGLPTIKTAEQKAPCADSRDIERAIVQGEEIGPLVALAAGTGLRISEILSLSIGSGTNYYDPTNALIRIQDGKTAAASRGIYLPAALNDLLSEFAGARTGPLFRSTKDQLYHRCRALGLPPFHAYRRYRTVHCRRSGLSEQILKYQLGHSSRDITDRYATRLVDDVAHVRAEIERVGLGFALNRV